MTNLSDEVDSVVEQLANYDIDAPRDDVETRLSNLTGEYAVPMDEAKRSVLRHYADEHDVDIDGVNSSSGGGTSTTEVNVEAIQSPDEWVTVEASVVRIWDNDVDSIAQTGLIGDETGRTKFTIWDGNGHPTLEEDTAYRFENVVTDEYQGRLSIQANSNSTIEPLDEDIDAADNHVTRTGALVGIQSGSGLIKRCPADDCTRVLQNSRCSEHGRVEGEFDLRIKGVLDDGSEVQHCIFDEDATEDVAGLTIEEAKEHAQEALDTTVVEQDLTEQLVGRYYEVEGPVMGRYLLVREVRTPETPAPSEVLEELGVSA